VLAIRNARSKISESAEYMHEISQHLGAAYTRLNNNANLVGAGVGFVAGAALGAEIGLVGGPAGVAIGGVLGGAVAGVLGYNYMGKLSSDILEKIAKTLDDIAIVLQSVENIIESIPRSGGCNIRPPTKLLAIQQQTVYIKQ
jgi:phage tail tape-measure protein